ncbi:MAG: putative manganese-dependent inorganic diphosphatase, partial [Erysipelotrichaceae bacterium]|nr:putative manganese-dependent inorganic diphosphatase [Erysipelotrichaceae bacterium]
HLMLDSEKKSVVVVNEKKQLLGMATLSDLARPAVIDEKLRADILSRTSLDYIIEAVNGTVELDCGNRSNGEIYVASYDNVDCAGKITVLSNNPERELQAIDAGAGMIIICGSECPPQVLARGRETDTTIILSPMHIYEVTRALGFAYPVEMVMTTDITTFGYNDYLDDLKRKINNSRYRSYPIVDAYNHIIGTISRYHVFQHANRNLILVDHNELTQSIMGAEEANILEIIDHHRIGGIKTASPVFFRNEQVGSCATIISEIFEEQNIPIPQDLAGLLCCAMISDTVNFRSVTCTETDRIQARKMAELAGLDIEELGPKILQAGTKLADKSVDAILNLDLKRFTIGKKKIAVGQANIISYDSIASLKNKMNDHLRQFSLTNGLNMCMMIFSMIDGTGSYVLCQGNDAGLVKEAFEDVMVNVDDFIFLPKIMSRKLQIIPRLTRTIEERG